MKEHDAAGPTPETEQPRELLTAKTHYSHAVQMLIEFYNNGELPNVAGVNIEPRYGYIASINYRDGSSRIITGQNRGMNPGSSEVLAADKGYSKFMLRSLGVKCPDGEDFLLPWWADTLRQSARNGTNKGIKDTPMAANYIRDNLEYPVYVKPASGSEGRGVNKVYEESELDAIFAEYEADKVKVALVERALNMPDYRLLVIDGRVVNAYERQPMHVVGNGASDIGSLIGELDESYKAQKREINIENRRDAIVRHIGRAGLSLVSVPAPFERVTLTNVSNLSAGGVPVDVGDVLHDRWRELAGKVAKGFNLRICGIDLACADITDPDSDYSVIEVNSSPGTQHFMASSPDAHDKLRAIFVDMFNTSAPLGDK